jgi:hypothetical protein
MRRPLVRAVGEVCKHPTARALLNSKPARLSLETRKIYLATQDADAEKHG